MADRNDYLLNSCLTLKSASESIYYNINIAKIKTLMPGRLKQSELKFNRTIIHCINFRAILTVRALSTIASELKYQVKIF